jgi:hypothetical protein
LFTSGVSLTAALMTGLCSPYAYYESCEQPLSLTALVGVPTGIVMASAGGIQWAITSKKARDFDPQAANRTGGGATTTSGKRATSLESKWAHLEGQRQIRKGTTLIVVGSLGMVGGAASVGAGFGAMAATGHYLGVIFALAGIGGAILFVPPSLAMIIVGSVLVHKGRKSQSTAHFTEYSPPRAYASIVPITTRYGAGLALQGRF